jgi:hypothetical protein
MVTTSIESERSLLKAFREFEQRLKQAVVGTLFTERNTVLLRFMAGELLMPADPTPPLKKTQYLSVCHDVSMSPHTLSAYEASPLQAVAKNGAEKSLEAIIESNNKQWAKKKKGSPMDPDVVNATMRDIITAKVPREVSCRMIRMLLKMHTYSAFDCSAFNLDHLPCFVVSEGRMDILRELCCYDPDTKNIPMTEFVTKKGVDQPCKCEEKSCNVAAWVQLFEIGCDISGCQESYDVRCMARMCEDGLKLFHLTEKKQPDRKPEEYDSFDSDAESDEEERETKKRKLSSD